MENFIFCAVTGAFLGWGNITSQYGGLRLHSKTSEIYKSWKTKYVKRKNNENLLHPLEKTKIFKTVKKPQKRSLGF